MTRRVLLRCDSTGDFYPVMAPSPIPHAFLVSQHTRHQRLGHPRNEEDVLSTQIPNPPVDLDTEESGDDTEEIFNKELFLRERNTAHVIPQSITYTAPPPFLATMEPLDTLSTGDEVISTTPTRENDEFIKSIVDDLVPIPRESGDIVDIDLPFREHLDTLSTGDREIDFNPSDLETIDPVPDPRMFNVPLDNDDSISRSFDVTISNPLFDFDDNYSLIIDNKNFDDKIEDLSSLDPLKATPLINESILLVTPLPDAKQICLREVERFDPFFSLTQTSDMTWVMKRPSYRFPHFPLPRQIPSDESKVHVEVLSVLWGNRLPIPDGSLPLSRMERGLRQGDPLSPFLFLLVVEALQISILEACDKGFFKGISLTNSGDNISLLRYADDALFFGEWSRLNAHNLILILKFFEEASGLKVNISKSRLFRVGVLIQMWRLFLSLLDALMLLPLLYTLVCQSKDSWSGDGVCFKDAYPRLFALDSNQDSKVNERCHFSDGVWDVK
ncbi:NAC domain-containing protein [Tanacetum coccineum]